MVSPWAMEANVTIKVITVEELPTDTRAAAVECARSLFLEYRQSLIDRGVPIDEFQGYQAEIMGLPGKYVTAHGGCIILAGECRSAGLASAIGGHPRSFSIIGRDGMPCVFTASACIAVRDLGQQDIQWQPSGNSSPSTFVCERVAELKRLYVAPGSRRCGLGRAITTAALDWCLREQGKPYHFVVLDTLKRLPGALELYVSLGFTPCAAYCPNPMDDCVFLAREIGGNPPVRMHTDI